MRTISCHFLPTPTPPPPAKLPAVQVTPPPPSSAELRRPPSTVTSTTSTRALESLTRPVPVLHDHNKDADQESISAFWDYQFLFVSQRSVSAESIPLRLVDGAVPHDFPSGTYYLTGPGVFSDDHGSTVHPLDGHGYLRAFSIDGPSGEVKFSARYIETEAQVEEYDVETGRWQFTHRGPFSVLRDGHKIGNTKVMKNVANTSVMKWGSHLLCLWEGGSPYEVDEATLDTVGLFDVVGGTDSPAGDSSDGGRSWPELGLDLAARFLKPILHGLFKMPEKRLLSHYKIDAKRNRLLMVSCNAEDMLLPRSNFTFYEYDTNFRILNKREFTIPDHLMIHDWAFTDTHYVIIGNRIKLDIPGSLLAVSGLSPMITALSVDPRRPSTPIYLLPRFSDETTDSRQCEVPIEAPTQEWILHVGNAFEQKDKMGNLQIQIYAASCSYQWFNFQKMFGYDWQTGRLDPSFMNASNGEETRLPHLVNISIGSNNDGSSTRCEIETLHQWSRPSDFPAINPAFSGSRNRYIYAGTSSGSRPTLPHFPFDSVAKIDVQDGSASTWSSTSRRFVGEPIFVPKGTEEDDGYLLAVEYAVSIQRCYLVILDPRRIGQPDALVSRLEVPKHLNFPLGFHGFWAQK